MIVNRPCSHSRSLERRGHVGRKQSEIPQKYSHNCVNWYITRKTDLAGSGIRTEANLKGSKEAIFARVRSVNVASPEVTTQGPSVTVTRSLIGHSRVKGAEIVPHVTRGLRAVLTTAAAATLAVGVLTSTAAAQPSTARAGIAGTHPKWATASTRMSSQPVTSGTVTARVYLAGQDPAGLAAFADGRVDPGQRAVRSLSDARAGDGAVRAHAGAGQRGNKLADRSRPDGDQGQGRDRRLRRGAGLGPSRRAGVRRDVRDLPGTGPQGRPGARGDGDRARQRGQRRADRHRAGHGHPQHDPGRHAAAAGPELLGRAAVLDSTTARRSRSISRPPTARSSRG